MTNQSENVLLNISSIKENEKNPRFVRDKRFQKLVQSIKEFPEMLELRPIVVDEEMTVLGGNMRLKALKEAGFEQILVKIAKGLTEDQKKKFIIKDNVACGEWDWEILSNEWDPVSLEGWGLEIGNFDLIPPEEEQGGVEQDDIPNLPEDTKTKPGDVYILGDHRLLCGDSTLMDHVEKLMDGEEAFLLHADPPYGMGKEKDGVLNDNLYEEKLDEFQVQWIHSFYPFLLKNASVYIWGNSRDLWRLWYNGGLSRIEDFEIANHIVWDKNDIAGMKSDLITQYPIASEHLLFIKRGDQLKGNVNKEDYFEGFDEIRLYLKDQFQKSGVTAKKIKELCGCDMYGHWISKSQWVLIPNNHYKTLQESFSGFFEKPWSQLKQIHEGSLNENKKAVRSYFDNSHDIMTDVWKFNRVKGEGRWGHATPKPLDLMERIIKSSSQKGSIVVEPFGGSGSTLIACEQLGRRCFTMELAPRYCDVIVDRWEKLTGKNAELLS